MRDLIRNPDGTMECPRHGLIFMVAHEVMVLERIYDVDREEFFTDDAEDVDHVVWYCDACDQHVPEEERSRPYSRTGHLTLPGARDLRVTARRLAHRLNGGVWGGGG